MKKIKLLALAFAIALSGTTAFAQQNSFSIGKIDFRRVILLHPKMADFQPSTSAFKISRDAKAKESYNTEVKDNEKQVAALEKEMQELKKKISAEDKAFDEKIDILTRKYLKRMDPKDKGQSGMMQMNYNNEAGSAEANHKAVVSALFAQYNMAEEKLLKLTQFNYGEGFTSPSETEKIFKSIVSETKVVLKRIADKKGIPVVLNAGFKKALKDNSGNSDVSYISDEYSLGAILNSRITEGIKKDEAAIAGFYNNLNGLVGNWIHEADPILNRINDNLLDSDILIGGEDLTDDVLAELYNTYKIDKEVANVIIQRCLSD